GSSFGILANLVPPFENGDELLCFSKDNLVYYPDSTYNCDKTVDIKEQAVIQEFSIYPNPVQRTLTVETDYAYKNTCFVKIFSAAGAEILRQDINSSTTNIEVSQLAKGFYIVQLVNGNSVQLKKFVKE
ncbi:MAG TPA: T9SS type A sorting domain-containing protein, partial [Bacteroidales bacterium]